LGKIIPIDPSLRSITLKVLQKALKWLTDPFLKHVNKNITVIKRMAIFFEMMRDSKEERSTYERVVKDNYEDFKKVASVYSRVTVNQ
jgi:hypothetical protein